MINLDLIEFADLVRPIEIVNQIFSQNQWINGAIPLEEIAFAAGIKEIKLASLKGFEGTLLANAEKTEGVIVINNGVKLDRQRFTLGHELGHFMIPRHGHQMQCSSADLSARSIPHMATNLVIEAEANEFSAELLMPKNLVKQQEWFKTTPSIEGVLAFAKKFEVSFQAAAIRFADLHDFPITVVISRQGRIVFGYKRQDFPLWLKVGKKGDLIPPKSLTGLIDSTKPETFNSDECLSSLWFCTHKHYELPENLIEDVYVQENGYVATILWFENELEEIEF